MDDTPSQRQNSKIKAVPSSKAPEPAPSRLRTPGPKLRRLIATLVIVGAMAGGTYWYWRNSILYPSTDNAYVQANVVRVAPLVSGPVVEVKVQDNARVAAGDELVRIDPAPFQAALDAAQARLDLAQLQQKGAGGGAQGVTAKANTDQAQAAVTKAKLELDYATVKAPAAGIIGNVHIRPGAIAQAGASLFPLVDTGQWWVDANFKETELARIATGQEATVTLDIDPSRVLKGKVESISPASGTAFSLLPAENASGNWVKVPQRFSVRISLDAPPADVPMRVGASASVTVDTTSKGTNGAR
jgi:membrane fusion protein (multidrug efflux system)